MRSRELTGREKQEIRRLVKTMCANYDEKYKCLPVNGDCYMFYGYGYTNTAMCKYFRNAVLPLNPELERVLTGGTVIETKPCGLCGKEFPLNGRQTYCSEKCAKTNRRKSVAKNVREHRKRKRTDV